MRSPRSSLIARSEHSEIEYSLFEHALAYSDVSHSQEMPSSSSVRQQRPSLYGTHGTSEYDSRPPR